MMNFEKYTKPEIEFLGINVIDTVVASNGNTGKPEEDELPGIPIFPGL